MDFLLQKDRAILHQLQFIIGLLNFACAVIRPGRAFLRRLIDLTMKLRAPHHHTKLNKVTKTELHLWLQILTGFNGKCSFVHE